MNPDFVKNAIHELVQGSIEESRAKEAEERARGVVLRDDPKARLLSPPRFSSNGSVILEFGVTTYLRSRRKWRAYQSSVQLVKHFSLDEQILYDIFHYLPGVALLVEKDNQWLVGVRSDNLAGTHAGMVSIPAGLMEPNENLFGAALRELKEETGLNGEIGAVSLGNNPDAPNVTFVCFVKNPEGDVQGTYEAKGKKFVWISKHQIINWICYGQERSAPQSIFRIFRNKSIDVSEKLQMAPDVREGIRDLLNI